MNEEILHRIEISGRPHIWRLIHSSTGSTVMIGERLKTDDKDTYEVVGGAPPTHSGSSGRVWTDTQFRRELFPHVLGLEWVCEEEKK